MEKEKALKVSFNRVKKDISFLREKTGNWIYVLNKNDRKILERLERLENRLSELEKALA